MENDKPVAATSVSGETSAGQDGLSLIAAERKRQIEAEGWTPEHDDEHVHGEIALAAIAYASPLPTKVFAAVRFNREIFGTKRWVDPWPWDAEWDKRKTHDDIKKLVIAGALIAAEIDRLKRKEKRDNYGIHETEKVKHARK